MSKIADFSDLEFTADQENAALLLEEFLESNTDVFLLKGYAGSGKTSLIRALVGYIRSKFISCQLMAPTGRAAKVLSSKTLWTATTIHRGIYSYDRLLEKEPTKEDKSYTLTYYYAIANNQNVNDAVLIIDEASMVSDMVSQQEFFRFGSGKLLKDLVEYSKIQNETNSTKIVFVGDPAQLPPVGMNTSPALNQEYIKETYNLKVAQTEMREVKRISAENPIKINSEIIRKSISSGVYTGFKLQSDGKSIKNINYSEFIDEYKNTNAPKIVLSYKNRTALEVNEEIRKAVFNRSGKIKKGDIIINSSNNYSLDIMNGEFAIVNSVGEELVSRRIALYKKGGEKTVVCLRWRWIELLFTEDHKVVEGYILENYLYSNKTNILPEEHQALYVDFKQRHLGLKPKTKEYKDAMYSDKYLNAIKLKYGYAITVHKSQGGEWDNVFVIWDRAQGKKNGVGLQNSDFYRWAYTAITRPQQRLINIEAPDFSMFSKMVFIDVEVQNELVAFVEGDSKVNSNPDFVVSLNDFTDDLVLYGVADMPLSFQHHFVKLSFIANKYGAGLISWQRKGDYEIWYQFEKEGETAGFKFWVNGKNVFKDNFVNIPKLTNSKMLFDTLKEDFEKLALYSIIDIETEPQSTQRKQEDRNFSDYEDKPFLQVLNQTLKKELKDIQITNIESMRYRERYTLSRGAEKVIVDFEYNKNGVFGRVLPKAKFCNSSKMLSDIKEVIYSLKTS